MTLTKSVTSIVEESNDPLLSIHTSWERVQIRYLGNILNGFAFKSKFFNNKNQGMPIIRIRDILNNKSNTFYSGTYEDRYLVSKGDILIGMDGDFNCSIWNGSQSLLNQRVCKIELTTENYSKDFFFLVLPSYLRAINENTSSQTVKHLSSESILEIPLPLPPLPEQHRIVSAIEALFARLDATNEKLDRVLEILKTFRESVLAAACDGRLTEGWREENPDIENSSLLLKKIKSFRKHVINSKQQVEEESDDNQNNEANGRYAYIPDTWNICQIKDISIVNLGGTPSRKIKSYWNGNINWLSSGEIANCRITSTKEKITEEGLRNSNAKLYPPKTVLIAMIGEGKTRGQSAILDIYSCTNQNVAALLFDTDHVSPEYVFRWALGEYEHNRSVGRGGSQPALNGQKVRELIIPLPPLPEQHEIVRRVDSLFAFADSFEAKVAAARAKTEKLRQSILAKAFSGELVETEAEIARIEGSGYETAEVLLERIKEERGRVGKKQ